MRFTIYGRKTHFGLARETVLTISPAGVQLKGPARAAATLSWHDVPHLKQREDTLIIREHTIDCSGHEQAHVDWLVAYLHGRSRRHAFTRAEREEFSHNSRHFAAIKDRDTTSLT